MLSEAARKSLTDRQCECLELWLCGYGSEAIGAMIGIAGVTVRWHIRRGRGRLGGESPRPTIIVTDINRLDPSRIKAWL